jgi:hypothetical protein
MQTVCMCAVGVIARSTSDCAHVLNAVAGERRAGRRIL